MRLRDRPDLNPPRDSVVVEAHQRLTSVVEIIGSIFPAILTLLRARSFLSFVVKVLTSFESPHEERRRLRAALTYTKKN